MITSHKTFQVACQRCARTDLFREGHWSEWTGAKIFNRGQLTAHLRAAGWTIGTVSTCPACVKAVR